LGHLKAGKRKQEVTEMFRIVLITLRRWVLRFVAKGVEGLKEQPGKGRKKKL
jgi:transposase